ncbi:MAG TPA: BlaI/MecI/CopY family transcriptional regulator [Verrucomicrobiae bacterium]|jgi:BlaI family penicillinase repressor|nr:BlaI/MecI/CopY family transcriptional regulator [Verrucomicrobiae bacterium]
MAQVPVISEAEWKVMKVLWTNSPLSAMEIFNALADTEDWHPNTVKTLLSRLHKKKALGVEKVKNLYLYRPLVSEADCVRTESASFLHRVFGGSVKPLLMHFMEKEPLSSQDLDELRKILRQRGK